MTGRQRRLAHDPTTSVRRLATFSLFILAACSRTSRQDRDAELLEVFGLQPGKSHDSSMAALRSELLRHVPVGASAEMANAYFDSLGFRDSPTGVTRRRTYARPGSVIIEARLEHHPHRWYDVGTCNYTHEIAFVLDTTSRVKLLTIDESGSCL
jgi:hypothetical protein